MLESFETGRNFDFQMERNTNQLARGAFLLFKTPSFGHTTTKRRDTHWMTFYKDAALKAVEEGK